MLRLLYAGTNIRQQGSKIIVRGIYRSKYLSAPFKDEPVICENKTNGKMFAGKVIAVDRDEHRYDAEIDLSREVSPKSIPGIFRNIGNLPSNDGDQPDGTLARSREFSVISQGTQKAAQ